MAGPGVIYEQAAKFRAELLRCEKSAATQIVRSYGEVWKRVGPSISGLMKRYYEAVDVGEEPDVSWLLMADRLLALQRQIEAEIRKVARSAETDILGAQWSAVEASQRHAEALVAPQMPEGVSVTWNRLGREAVIDLIGFSSDGSPLRELLDKLPGDAGERVREEIVAGAILGQGPRQIAGRCREALGGNMARALRISRTEVLRSYRESSLRNYQANAGLVRGWIWHSATDVRTCPMCWAMHGTEHGLEDRLDDHVQGRCAMVPKSKSWAELGFPGIEEPVMVEPGAEVFARLDEAKQRAILGPAAHEAYRTGAITLSDFVGRSESVQWGTMRYAKSLSAILAASLAKLAPGSLERLRVEKELDDLTRRRGLG